MPSPAGGTRLFSSRRAWIEHEPSWLTRPSAVQAEAWESHVVHPGAQSAIDEHSDVSSYATPSTVESWATRVRPDRVLLDAEREFPFLKLYRVVALVAEVDHVQAIACGTRALP